MGKLVRNIIGCKVINRCAKNTENIEKKKRQKPNSIIPNPWNPRIPKLPEGQGRERGGGEAGILKEVTPVCQLSCSLARKKKIWRS